MSGEGIFVSILPRLELAALATAVGQMKSIFGKAGDEIGRSLSGAQKAVLAAEDAMVAASNRAANAQIRAAKLVGDAQVQEARRGQVAEAARMKAVEDRTAREIAAINAVDYARAKAGQATAEAEQASSKAASATAEHDAAMVAAGASANKFATGLNTVGAAATGVFALLGGEGVKQAASFEQGLTQLQAATDETTSNIKALHDGLLQLSPQLGRSLKDLTDASYIAAKSGWKDAADQLKLVATGAQLATIEAAPLENTMKALTTTMQDFSFPMSSLEDVASMVRTAAGNAKVTLDEFAGSVHNVEPIMKTLVNGDASKAPAFFAQMSGMLAMMTQNGTSADQASQNLRNTFLQLVKGTQPVRDMVGALGGSFADLSKELDDPNVGPYGVLLKLNDLIKNRLTPDGQVHIQQLYESADAANVLKERYDALSPSAKKVADAIQAGTIDLKDLHAEKQLGPDAAQITQWDQMRRQVEGFNPIVKKYGTDMLTLQQAWKQLTGSDQGFLVAAQTLGNPAAQQETSSLIQRIQGSHAETGADGQKEVEGWSKVSQTLNQQMKETNSALQSMATQMGEVLLPKVKEFAEAMKDVFNWLSSHKGVLDGIITSLEYMAAAWVGLKAKMMLQGVWESMSNLLERATGGFNTLRLTANDASTAMTATGPAAARGATGVEAAAAAETASMGRVGTAAEGAASKMAGIGAAAARAIPYVAALAAALEAEKNWGPRPDDFDPQKSPWYHQLFGKGGDFVAGLFSGGGAPPSPGNIIGHNADGTPIYGHPASQSPGAGGLAGAQAARRGGVHSADAPSVLNDLYSQATGGPAPEDYMGDGTDYSGGGGGGGGGATFTPSDALDALAGNMAGTPYSQGNRTDCSGMVARLIDQFMGLPETDLMTTKNAQQWLGARGFVDGVGPPGTLRVGWYDHGGGPNDGHMAATLPDGTNYESGGSGGGLHLGGSVGADSPEFDHHMYLPMDMMGLSSGAPSGFTGSTGTGSLPSMLGGSSTMPTGGGASYNPLEEAASGGFTLPGIARMATTFLAELALGNPLGKLESGQASNYAWWYQGGQGGGGSAGGAGLDGLGLLPAPTGMNAQNSLKVDSAMNRVQSSYISATQAVQKYGEGSAQAAKAQLSLNNAVNSYNQIIMNMGVQQQNAADKAARGMNQLATQQQRGQEGFHSLSGAMANQNAIANTQASINNNAAKAAGAGIPITDYLGGGGQGPLLRSPKAPVGASGGGGGGGGGLFGLGGNSTIARGGAGPSGSPLGGRSAGANGSKQMGSDNKSSGFGISGGLIGSLESAASQAAGAAAGAFTFGAGGGAASAATDLITQEANRAAGYIGQLGGIAAEGLLETFSLNDSAIADPSKSLIGKVIFGLAGAHANTPNQAGNFAPPLKPDDQKQGAVGKNGNQLTGLNVQGDMNVNGANTDDVVQQIQQSQNRGMMALNRGQKPT